jgi:5-formyltetrahydrofolate cyclo-ligase
MGLAAMIEVKSELRSALISARARAYTEEPNAGEALVHSAAQILSRANTPIVAGYIPFKTEIDPRLAKAVALHQARDFAAAEKIYRASFMVGCKQNYRSLLYKFKRGSKFLRDL